MASNESPPNLDTSAALDVESIEKLLTCAIFPEQPYKCDILHTIKFSVSILSFLASLFMIFIIWLFRKYELFRQRLILYLSISSAITSLTYLFATNPESSNTLKCTIDGFFATYCDWSVLLWILNITFNLTYQVQALANRKSSGSSNQKDNTEMFMQLIGWMLPLGIAAIPFVANVYGPAGGWCWIPPNKHLWRLFTWYLWNTLGIALLFSMIGYSRYLLKRVSEQSYMGTWDPSFSRRKKALEQDRRTLQNYPIVYTVTSIFPIYLRLHNMFNGDSDQAPFWLWVLVTIMVPMNGVINALVFGLDPETRQKMTLQQIRLQWYSHWDKPMIVNYPMHRFKQTESDQEENQSLLSQ